MEMFKYLIMDTEGGDNYGRYNIFIFLGVGIASGCYELLAELRNKKINKLISKSLVDILEGSTMRIGERSKILKRELTEAEKDKVIDEYYNEYKQNKVVSM